MASALPQVADVATRASDSLGVSAARLLPPGEPDPRSIAFLLHKLATDDEFRRELESIPYHTLRAHRVPPAALPWAPVALPTKDEAARALRRAVRDGLVPDIEAWSPCGGSGVGNFC